MHKLLSRLYNFLNGDRINPGIINFSLITFLSLKESILSFIKQFVKKGDKVLDFGCGNMVYKKFFVDKEIDKYVGIDIGDSPEYNDDYIVYGGGVLPIKDNEFDIILSTQVFEHLEDPFFYGKELERVAKSGGYLFISIAHIWEYHPYPKHYFNIFYDAIPLIFPNSQIIDIRGDTTNIQNSLQILQVSLFRKNKILGLLYVLVNNILIKFLAGIGICKIQPVDYFTNSLTGNILITLKVNK